VWEDGFCDFLECERTGSGYMKGSFGTDIFFKMSHEVYNFVRVHIYFQNAVGENE
jgi:hypothetical protein